MFSLKFLNPMNWFRPRHEEPLDEDDLWLSLADELTEELQAQDREASGRLWNKIRHSPGSPIV